MLREALTPDMLQSLPPNEAAALFVCRRADGLTESEATLLSAWLAERQGNRDAFARAEQAWSVFDDADGDEVLTAMRKRVLSAPSGRPAWHRRAAAAAVLLLMFGVGMIAILAPPGGEEAPQPGQPAGIRYAASGTQVRTVKLPDGSSMTLDAGSAAIVRFGQELRAVELQQGRAYFAVAPNSARPFEVATGDRRVVAVGTRFDVGRRGRELTVTLVEGRVTVGPLDRSVEPVALDAGQQFVERAGRPVIRTMGAEAVAATGWRTGLLSFNDETLAAAVAQVNLYSPERITIDGPAIGSLRISGQFQAGDAERFAKTVSEVHPVRVRRNPSGIILVPAT